MMRSKLCPALAALVMMGPLTAQNAQELPWSVLLKDKDAGVLLKVRVLPVSKGYAVEFRNDGTEAITFNFLLRGIQNRLRGPGNGNISLEPGDESGVVLVSTPGGAALAVPIDLFQIRLGHEGQGLFWRE